MSDSPLDEKVLAELATPRAYPRDASAAEGVEWVQTHLSHVFLTGERVYKFRKDVFPGFLDFRSRAERNRDCLREVALNRRLAPDVYLGVAALRVDAEGVRVEEVGESLCADGEGGELEHCVVMRRLPAGRDALSLLSRGALRAAQLDRVAAVMADFHVEHGLGAPAPFAPDAWLERCTGPARESYELLAATDDAVDRDRLEAAHSRSDAFVASRAERFESRRVAGRCVDGHGDLHLQHVWFERDDADPLMIDCLEFSEPLRCIDAAAEVAFLAMDLGYRGEQALAERFLRRYARARDDFDLYGVVDWYRSYRAAVRAKVAALAAVDETIPAAQRAAARESVDRHLEYAAACLEPAPPGPLLLVSGSVGVGKSTAAERLADALGGAVVASDFVRKQRRGLAPGERPDDASSLYSESEKEEVYREMLVRARWIAESGRVAVLDATYSRARHRAAAAAFGRALGSPVFALELRCEDRVARERLARRAARGGDASDAGPELQRASAAAFEPWEGWPAGDRFSLRTDREGWQESLAEVAAEVERRLAR